MCTRKTDQEIAPFITNEDVRIDEHSKNLCPQSNGHCLHTLRFAKIAKSWKINVVPM